MVWDALLLDMKVLTFFMGKAVSSNNLTCKQIQDWLILSWDHIYPWHRSVPFTEKWLRKLETGVTNKSLNKWNSLKIFIEI